MSDAATGILHPNPGEAVEQQPVGAAAPAAAATVGAAAPTDPAVARNAARDANLRKAQAASAAARKAKLSGSVKRPRGRPRKVAPSLPTPQDPIAAAVHSELLAHPVKSAADLARLIATVEESLAAIAPLAGAKGVFLVRALAWSDGKGAPSAQCTMAANFMWPWMKRQDVFGKLAASSDTLMFCAGVTILVAPFATTVAQLFFPARRLRVVESPHVEQPEAPRNGAGAGGQSSAPASPGS